MPPSQTAERPPSPVELAVVVPVRNEQGNISPLIDEISRALGAVNFEIVYVNDGSTDATASILADCAKKYPALKVVTHKAAFGQSAAIASGIKAARATVIATIDGDGQNDPADIPRLLAVYNEADDNARLLVAGLRTVRKDTWAKRMSSRIANRVRRRLLHDDTPDTGCGLKVFSRSTFMEMPRFDHMHRFLPALMMRQGGRVVSVPVNHRRRRSGVTKYGLFDRLWVGIIDLFGVV
ncbi:MAG TPA: glycosyltransferase, partial [Alphaproteobacteria bacterium]|nr:glycosyltransferase [Alphaproteobacteria bacterium]